MLKKKITLILLFIICIMLCSCQKEEETAYEELTMRDSGLPYSDWGNSTTGSAKYLDGSSVLVTIYLDDVNSHWSDLDEQLVADNMKIACDYLTEQGKEYGKDVELIYDTSKDSDLSYRLSYKEAFSGSTQVKSKGDKTDQLVVAVYDYIENSIDTEAILEKYNVNSIGYMVFIDGESDKCTAYCYHTNYKEYFYEEFCLINLRWNGGYDVYPDTYAHEILHIFGARDLYYTDEYDGMSKDFIDYVYEEYDTDIMLGNATNVVCHSDKIPSDITKITAYYLGWQGYITELEDYPSIKSKYVATFSKSTDTKGGNYLEYSLTPRKKRGGTYSGYKESMITDKLYAIIMIFIFIIMLIRFLIIERRHRKRAVVYSNKQSDNNRDNNLSIDYMNQLYINRPDSVGQTSNYTDEIIDNE